jgi:hypothetical protein
LHLCYGCDASGLQYCVIVERLQRADPGTGLARRIPIHERYSALPVSLETLTRSVPSLPVAVGAAVAALIVLGTVTTRWRAVGGWTAVAVLGSAASLSLIDAGRTVHYQHYLDWPAIPSRNVVAAAVLLAQAVLVLLAGVRHERIRRAAGWIRTNIGLGTAAVFVVALGLLSATVNQDVGAYVREIVTSTAIQLLQLATITFAALSWPTSAPSPVEGSERSSARAVGRFECIVAALVVVACLGLNWLVYERHPHVPDEVQYLFQAAYFAHGKIAIAVPPVPRAFETYLTEWGPHGWYSVVPPGWPLVLAIGSAVGLESWVNPILAGLNVLLTAVLLHGLYGPRIRRIGVLLLAVSPWHLFLGMSYMPQTVTLTLGLVGAVAVERCRRNGSVAWAWLAGGTLGYLAIVRQLDAMIAAILLGLWAIGLGGRRLKPAGIAGLVLGAMVVATAILPYNRHFTGKATKFPIMAYNDRVYGPGTNDYGFGKNRGMGWGLDPRPGHDPIDGMINSNLNATATEVELFGWSFGSLGFALLHLLVAWRRLSRPDRAMIGAIVVVWAAYFLNYFAGGPDFGARYWFLMIVPLVALTARGIETLEQLPDPTGAKLGRRADALAGVATLVALLVFVPWRSIDKYWHFRGMRADVRTLASDGRFDGGLVLVNGRLVPDFASAAAYNPLDWNAKQPLYAWNRDSTVAVELRAAFPTRPIWIMDGPTRTGGGYRIVAGPIPPGAPVPVSAAALSAPRPPR